MLTSVSTIDNNHPANWQWVTTRSETVASAWTETCAFLLCCTYGLFLVEASASLPVRRVFVHLSLRARLWASGQVMAGWNYGSGLSHPHLSLGVLRCQACLINVLRSVARGEISVSGWARLGLCCPLCSRSGVYTSQGGGMCYLDMISLCDLSALSVPASVTFSVFTLDTWGLKWTHVFAQREFLTEFEQWCISKQCWQGKWWTNEVGKTLKPFYFYTKLLFVCFFFLTTFWLYSLINSPTCLVSS